MTEALRRAAGRALAVAVAGVLVGLAAGAPARADGRPFDCVIAPSKTVKLGSPATGILAEVLVARGDMVAAGDVIARLESKVEAATVTLNKARAENSARIDAQVARVTLSRGRVGRAVQLYEKKVMAQDKYDELQAELQVAQQELEREQLERRLAQLEQERSEAQLEQRTIRSPSAGVISERKLAAGEPARQLDYLFSAPTTPRPRSNWTMWTTTDQAVDMYARFCRARYGAGASRMVEQKAAELRRQGDVEGERVWMSVKREIESQIATQRSFIMTAIVTAIVLVAVMVDRSVLTLRNLALAALGVMLLVPEAVVHPSFQMSFAATLVVIAATNA